MTYEEERLAFENRVTYNIMAGISFVFSMMATMPLWNEGHAALMWMLGLSYWPFILAGSMLTIHSIGRSMSGSLTRTFYSFVWFIVPWCAGMALTYLIAASLR